MSKYGLWNSQGVIDKQLLASNFMEWTWKYLSPIADKKFGTDFSDEKTRAALFTFISTMIPGQKTLDYALLGSIIKESLVHKDERLYGLVDPRTIAAMSDKDPSNVLKAFGTAFMNFGTALISPGIQMGLPILENLTEGLNALTHLLEWIHTTNFTDEFTGLYNKIKGAQTVPIGQAMKDIWHGDYRDQMGANLSPSALRVVTANANDASYGAEMYAKSMNPNTVKQPVQVNLNVDGQQFASMMYDMLVKDGTLASWSAASFSSPSSITPSSGSVYHYGS